MAFNRMPSSAQSKGIVFVREIGAPFIAT